MNAQETQPSSGLTLSDVQKLRDLSGRSHLWALAKDVVFLNHGSFGACLKAVMSRQSSLRKQMEARPVQFLWRHYEERLEASRQAVAQFVGARPADLVFVSNATTGVNAVVRSLNLRPGDQVLTTNLDYNACHNALAVGVREKCGELVTARIPFPLRSADEVVEAVLGAVTARTRLAMLDHVTSNTGMVLPLERLVAELEKREVDTLVDGAHAPGMLPLDLQKLGAAYYTGNLHKWVCAPKGTAFLWAREDKQAGLNPPVVSHGNNTPRPGYSQFQDRFDWAGTADPTGWFCAGYAIKRMGGIYSDGGWKELRKHNNDLVVNGRRVLCENLGVEPPCPEDMLGSMATIPLPNRFQGKPRLSKIDPEQIALYDNFHVEVPFVRIGNPEHRYFRISAQAYNIPEDYQYLAQCLGSLAD